jgi:hypothetical protein
MCGAGHHDPGAQKRHLAAEMTHHNVPFRRQWKRDAAERLAEVPPWVWGLLMLTVFSAFVAVLGVGLLAGGSHAGVFVLLGGAAVVATVVAYWVEGMTDGGSGAGKPKRGCGVTGRPSGPALCVVGRVTPTRLTRNGGVRPCRAQGTRE